MVYALNLGKRAILAAAVRSSWPGNAALAAATVTADRGALAGSSLGRRRRGSGDAFTACGELELLLSALPLLVLLLPSTRAVSPVLVSTSGWWGGGNSSVKLAISR